MTTFFRTDNFEKPKDLFYQKVIWKIALDGGMGASCLFANTIV